MYRKKILRRKRYTLAATLRDTPCLTTLPLTLPFPIISPSLFLIQAALAGGWFKKKIFKRKRYSLAATWLGSSALLPSGHSPSPPPFFPHPVFLIQAAISGGWRQSCVHYNSLG
eukprot:scaffold16686_cov97-Isochrysis_galbana.AAC.4